MGHILLLNLRFKIDGSTKYTTLINATCTLIPFMQWWLRPRVIFNRKFNGFHFKTALSSFFSFLYRRFYHIIDFYNLILTFITFGDSIFYCWLQFGSMINNFDKSSIASNGKLFRALINSFQEFILNVVPLTNSFYTYADFNHAVSNPSYFLWCLLFHLFSNILRKPKEKLLLRYY